MALRIKHNTFVEVCSLEVAATGVKYVKTAFLGGTHRFRFDEIDCVLMSSGFVLSFQVGNEVFSIQTSPGNQKDQAVIEALLSGVRRTSAVGGLA